MNSNNISDKKIQYSTNDYIECLKATMPYKSDDEIESIAIDNLKLFDRLTK